MIFNAKKVKDDCVEWIRNWFDINGNGCNAVVGISGGKDSTIVAALCCEALGKDRVIGVLMPNGDQTDFADACAVVDHLGISRYIINICDAVSEIKVSLEHALNPNFGADGGYTVISEQASINLPPRIRMATLYAVSQSVNGRVANTCNLSENWIGYSTRYGDAAGDFSPLSNLTVTECRAIGKELGLPIILVEKIPADGLCNKTDEDSFGFSYEVLDKYIKTGMCENQEVKNKIDDMNRKNKFKMEKMQCFIPKEF